MSTNNITNPSQLLTSSTSFCMAPWIHIHTSPTGIASPCCIAEAGYAEGVGNSINQSLIDLVNSEKMNELRLNMLTDVKNPMCSTCHRHEEHGVESFRQSFNNQYSQYINEIADTNSDGSLNDFKMRYFDIRFSNICNFKCRSCNSSFSSQWELEDKRSKRPSAWTVPKNNSKPFLKEILNQIEFIDEAYFAGGEPLITEQHYIILEEMIRQKRTDIRLKYNSNLSNFKFKDKDLMGLWKHFTNGVFISASIDHFGERAEYIRHGTDWATVENNFIIAKQNPHITLQMNTVLSMYNYTTLFEFYEYLINKNLYSANDLTYSLYNMVSPRELAAHVLPIEYKDLGKEKLAAVVKLFQNNKFSQQKINHLTAILPWVYSEHTWDNEKENFQNETARLDKIRGESFVKTFPELASLMD